MIDAVTDPGRRATIAAALADRRDVVRSLLHANPEAIVRNALPEDVRSKLSPSEREQVERYVSAVGDFNVYAEIPAPGTSGRETSRYEVVIDGQRYNAIVYGRRLSQGSKERIPLQGVVVDGIFVLDDDPIEYLDAAPQGEVVDADDGILYGEGVYARSGGVVYRFQSRDSVESVKKALVETESRLGPLPRKSFRKVIERSTGGVSALSVSSGSNVIEGLAASPGTSDWGVGEKRVLVVRVLTADSAATDPFGPSGVPLTRALCEQTMETVAAYYQSASYGKTWLVSTVTPKTYRVSRTAAYYAAESDRFGQIPDDVKPLVEADYDLSQFDRIIYLHNSFVEIPGSQALWGGMGQVGGKVSWANGYFDLGIVAHELGHNYGIRHAGSFHLDDDDPVSPGAEIDQYGDVFDIMGGGRDATSEFNPTSKRIMGWIDQAHIKTVTANGVYRVHNFNATNAAAVAKAVVALKLKKDSDSDVWIAFRGDYVQRAQHSHTPTNITSSAYIYLDGPNFSVCRTVALDLNPQTPHMWDAGLAVGSTFGDRHAGYSIKTVAIGGSGSNRYLDIEILMPEAPSLIAHPVDVSAMAGTTAVFQVTAARPFSASYVWQVSKDNGVSWLPVSGIGQGTPKLYIHWVTTASDGHRYRCVVKNALGSVTSSSARLTVSGPPAVIHHPWTSVTRAGSTARFSVSAAGEATYQWSVSKNAGSSWTNIIDGAPYSGATSSSLTVTVSPSMNGYRYRCTITNAIGSATTMSAALVVSENINRLTNISTRAFVGTGDNVAIAGLVIETRTTVLVRGVGPTLRDFGVSGVLEKPGIRLFNNIEQIIASNEGWQSDPAEIDSLELAMSRMGAMPLSSSDDCALLITLNPGIYTAHLYGRGDTTGNGLIEIYRDPAGISLAGELFRNLSSRVLIGSGDSIGIVGFVLENSSRVLIRGVGPSLGSMGMTTALASTFLRLHNAQGGVMATNVGWRNGNDVTAITEAAVKAGAFSLSSDGDSVLLLDLPAGAYSAHLLGLNGAEGNALLEVYVAQ